MHWAPCGTRKMVWPATLLEIGRRETRGSSEKVGWWMRAQGEGLGVRGCHPWETELHTQAYARADDFWFQDSNPQL